MINKKSQSRLFSIIFVSKNKKGVERWTVAKLIKWVLLIILLALVIWGSVSGQLNPLYEQVSSKFDEVLLVLGISGNAPEAGCRPGNSVDSNSITDVTATLKICRDSCTYTLQTPPTLFGFNELTIDRGGPKIGNEEKSYSFNDIVSSYDVGTPLSDYSMDRSIYRDMKDIFDGFSSSYPEHDMVDIESSVRAYFTVIVSQNKGFLEKKRDDIVYEWDGTYWSRETGGRSEELRESDVDFVVDEIYDYYRDGDYIYWGYKGEDVSNIPGSNFNVNYQDAKIDYLELEEWFDNKTKHVDKNKDTFRIDIEDTGALYTDSKYYYNNGVIRKERGFIGSIFRSDIIIEEKEKLLLDIISWNEENQKMWWRFDSHEEDKRYVIVEDEPIISLEDFKDNLKTWIRGMANNYTEDRKDREELIGDFSNYISNREVQGKKVYIKIIEVPRKGQKNFVYIDYETYMTGFNDDIKVDVKKGVYRDEGELKFVTISTYSDNGQTIIEDGSAWAGLDNYEWDDFEKTHNIFEVLYERCGRDEEI